ncbi:MAG: hypothetical protein CMP39_03910 [Rickettsiales bacterium]|nr:hypothetical protein [Rickettsiales bacterium]|tara:strand:+ start:1078 stop:1584 length:507 start_codon:yes stop_codon:yes gene_type:complete
MNIYDIIIAVVLGYHLVTGFRAGAIKIIGRTAALLMCFSFSKKNYLIVEPVLKTIFNIHPRIQNLVNFATTFVLSYLFGLFVLQIIFKFLKVVHEGTFDHLLGALLGLIKGVIISLVITIPLLVLNFNWVGNSFIITQIRPILDVLIYWMERNEYFNNFLEILNAQKK